LFILFAGKLWNSV